MVPSVFDDTARKTMGVPGASIPNKNLRGYEDNRFFRIDIGVGRKPQRINREQLVSIFVYALRLQDGVEPKSIPAGYNETAWAWNSDPNCEYKMPELTGSGRYKIPTGGRRLANVTSVLGPRPPEEGITFPRTWSNYRSAHTWKNDGNVPLYVPSARPPATRPILKLDGDSWRRKVTPSVPRPCADEARTVRFERTPTPFPTALYAGAMSLNAPSADDVPEPDFGVAAAARASVKETLERLRQKARDSKTSRAAPSFATGPLEDSVVALSGAEDVDGDYVAEEFAVDDDDEYVVT